MPGGLVPVNVTATTPPGSARLLRTYGNKQKDGWLGPTEREIPKISMRPIAAEKTHADINTFKKNMAVAAAFANHLTANLLRTTTFRADKTGRFRRRDGPLGELKRAVWECKTAVDGKRRRAGRL